MLMAGLALFGVASLLSAMASSLWLLIGARALQGMGAAFLMTLAMALTRQTTSTARMGRAMGLLGTVSALGTALGPSLGGLLLDVAGWRSLFWLQFLLAGIALILALLVLPDGPITKRTTSVSWWSLLERELAPHLLINLLVAAIMMTTLVVGPFYLALGLGLNASGVGFVMAIGPVISIFSGVPSGRLVDAWGSRQLLLLGLALLILGAFLLALLPNFMGVAGYVLAIVVLTPGYQLFQAANNTATLVNVPADRQGTVSGLLNLSRNLGLITGASAMGALFAMGVGTDDPALATASAIADGMQLTFLVAAGMMMAALAIARIPTRG